MNYLKYMSETLNFVQKEIDKTLTAEQELVPEDTQPQMDKCNFCGEENVNVKEYAGCDEQGDVIDGVKICDECGENIEDIR